jgi:uncharacterized paraquat-inducible protein A
VGNVRGRATLPRDGSRGPKEASWMVRCPVCESARVVVVLSSKRRAYCVKCATKWIQDGNVQRSIEPGVPAGPVFTPPLIAN